MNKFLTFLAFLCAVLNVHGQSSQQKVYDSIQEAINDSLGVRSLDLSEKNLSELPTEILRLKNLEDIDLEANPNLDFDKTLRLLSKLKNLKTLGLGRNKLSNIPKSISELPSLNYLSLEENDFTQIPESVKRLKITTLYLFDNKIRKLNLNKGDLSNLENINLCYNEFKIFPVELSIIPGLKTITMWYNSMKVIPSGIINFKRIEDIIIDHNELTKIPNQISSLKSLKRLIVTHNQLDAKAIMPIFKLQNLESLELTENKINYLPSEIGDLKNLKRLDISLNPLKKLPMEIVKLTKLEQIGLGQLYLDNWTETFSMLEKLSNLNRVGLYKMGLKTMPDGFEKLTQVSQFWLNGNSFNKQEVVRLKQLFPKAKMDF